VGELLAPAMGHRDGLLVARPVASRSAHAGRAEHHGFEQERLARRDRTARRLGRGRLQAKLVVGEAADRFEQEADAVADAMARTTTTPIERSFPGETAEPSRARLAQRVPVPKGEDPEKERRKDVVPGKRIQKSGPAGSRGGDAPVGVEDVVGRAEGGGLPLPRPVRTRLEDHLGHDLEDVRVHTGPAAAGSASVIGARAFTVGRNVFFGAGEYRPGTAGGDRLIAHEVVHTVQQRDGVRPSPRAQRGLFDDGVDAVLRRVRGWAVRVPGYELLTVFLGRDPITDTPVERSAVNLVHGALGLVPNGEAIFADLQQSRTIERTVEWLEQEWGRVGLTWTSIKALFRRAWDALSWRDILSPGDAWDRIRAIFAPPIERLIAFVGAVGRRVIDAIKTRVLGFLRSHAEGITGYRLLTFILGKDPLTDEPVPRTAENFVRAVLDLVPGGDAVFQNLQRSRTIERTVTWLREQIVTLDLTWEGIKALFRRAWDTFSLADLLHPLTLIERVVEIFGPAVRRVGRFALAVGKKVLEFIFEGVMALAGPIGTQVVRIVHRAGEAFDRIVADPVAFIGNLVGALRRGFDQFRHNIVGHLREGIFGWLFGALEGAGLQLPTVWDLRGIVSLVLQVLGLTYQRFRTKLVTLVGEPRVAMLERVFDFLRILITEGVAAAWQKIVEALGNVTDIVIGAIREWAITRIVTAAITRLATLLNPVGAVIQSIIAIYNTIRFFIERIQQILALVESIVESIANIAAGRLAAAANYVERSMARTIPVILSFLARFIGLGDVSGAIRNVITGIQARVDAAIDRVIAWIVERGRALLGGTAPAAAPAAGADDPRWVAGVAGVHGEIGKLRNEGLTPQLLEERRAGWAQQFGFRSLTIDPLADGWEVDGEMSPRRAVEKVQGVPPIFTPTSMSGGRPKSVYQIPVIATSYASPQPNDIPGWQRLEHTRWVRGHLLHGRSGGPGTAVNLVPITKTANIGMWLGHEQEIFENQLGGQSKVGKQPKNLVWFKADVSYHTRATATVSSPGDFVRQIKVQWGTAKLKGSAWQQGPVSAQPVYDVAAPTTPDLVP
jgi:hypothetical protein